MMQVYVDGELVDEAGTTLSAALENALLAREGHLIVEAEADGEPVPQAHFADPPETSPYAGELRLRTARASVLIREILLDISEMLESLPQLQQRCAELFQEGRFQDTIEPLQEVFGCWDSISRACWMSAQTCPELVERVTPGLETIGPDLTRHLEEVRDAMSAEDFTTVADLLMDELGEDAQCFLAFAEGVAHAAGEAQTSET